LINTVWDVISFPLLIALLFLISSPLFIPLCLPGVVVFYFLRKYLHLRYVLKSAVLSLVVTTFMSPFWLEGHTPIFLPLPFGIWCALYFKHQNILKNAIASIVITVIICIIVTTYFWKREKLGIPVIGRFEKIWRGN
jgi:hypothetical protein